MFRSSVAAAAVIVAALAAFGSPAAGEPIITETLTLDAYSPADSGFAGPVTTSAPLASGARYEITVTGTFSAFNPKLWTGFPQWVVCGAPEAHPMTASSARADGGNGPVGQDANDTFARPFRGSCPPAETYPHPYSGFQIDLGSGFSHLDPTGLASVHSYVYDVTGQGSPASFRILDFPTDDDYGELTISVRSLSQTAEPASTPAAVITMPPSRGCVDTRRFKFRFHHDAGARVVRVQVYVNGALRIDRRGRDIKRLTLRRLPERRFVVKIVATQSSGTVLITRRTYHGCRKTRPRTSVHHLHRG
jgi:hypothetical protein